MRGPAPVALRAAVALAAGALAVLAFGRAPAHAHGVPAAVGAIAFDPRDPDHVVVRATWGFLTTRDRGETWTWQCAAAVPFDGAREEPTIGIVASGEVLAATFGGLFRTDSGGCNWYAPKTAPTSVYVTDLAIDPTNDRVVFCIESSGSRPDVIYRSDDEGVTFSLVAVPHERALTDRIRIARSDPMRIYTSGVIPRTDTAPRQGVVLRSDDRGATFRVMLVPLLDGERTVFLLGIDPRNADHLLVRTVRGRTDTLPERVLRSEDGGATWASVLEIGWLSGFAASDDGRTVWIGNRDGGLYRSRDGGRSFAPIDPTLRVRALAYRPGELWVGVDNFAHAYAIAISHDDGDTFTPLWTFGDLVNDLGCPAESPVGTTCPAFWPDVQNDLSPDGGLGVDAAVSADAGAATMDADGGGGAGSRPGCACRAIVRRAPGGLVPVSAALLALLALRRSAHLRAARGRI